MEKLLDLLFLPISEKMSIVLAIIKTFITIYIVQKIIPNNLDIFSFYEADFFENIRDYISNGSFIFLGLYLFFAYIFVFLIIKIIIKTLIERKVKKKAKSFKPYYHSILLSQGDFTETIPKKSYKIHFLKKVLSFFNFIEKHENIWIPSITYYNFKENLNDYIKNNDEIEISWMYDLLIILSISSIRLVIGLFEKNSSIFLETLILLIISIISMYFVYFSAFWGNVMLYYSKNLKIILLKIEKIKFIEN